MMTLNQWLDTQPGLTLAAFGERIDATHSTVSRLRRGLMLPAWPMMLRILRATGGQVTPDSFIPADALDELPPEADLRQIALPLNLDQVAA